MSQTAEADRPLTARRKAFIQEYQIDRHGKRAAIRAGYSPHTAGVQAAQLLANPKIRKFIQEVDDRYAAKIDITREKIAELLLEDRLFAREMEAPAPAITATTTLARLYGLIDKQLMGPTMDGAQLAPLQPGQSRVVVERQVLEIFTSTPEVSGGEIDNEG